MAANLGISMFDVGGGGSPFEVFQRKTWGSLLGVPLFWAHLVLEGLAGRISKGYSRLLARRK